MGIFEAFGSLARHAALSYLLNYLGRKKVVNLTIDNEKKLINVDIFFKEDNDHIQAVAKYRLEENSKGTSIQIENLNISKQWLDVLAKPLIKKKQFTIPEEYSDIAKLLI